jgi:L-ascorbate metabolism protein UlaG (beta-lactamase superfamily)
VTWFLGIVGVIVGLVLLAAGFVLLQYGKHRRGLPKPSYKRPKHRPALQEWGRESVTVSWIGHSTVLIDLFGLRIVTDPVFEEKVGVRVAGAVTIGPKRHTAAALSAEDVGEVDLILLSHAHLDHMDLPSLRKLASPKTRVVTARGTSRLLKGMAFQDVQELGGKDSLQLDGLCITAVPVRHWGARFPWNKEYEWTGYLIEYRGVRLFFAGDTAYTPTFRELREYGEIDLAMLPIGAYAPDSYQRAHCTPEQAWQMFLDSGARLLVPIHWDTFVLSREPVEEPMQRLLRAAGEQAERIVIREHGETFRLSTAEWRQVARG